MGKKLSALPAPSQTDLEILSVLWDRGKATAREIHQELIEKEVLRNGVAYTTVKTYLDRLVQKGYARAQALGDSRGTYIYTAMVSREDVRDRPGLLDRIVRTLGLRPPEFAQWFYEQDELTEKDKEELQKILRDRTK